MCFSFHENLGLMLMRGEIIKAFYIFFFLTITYSLQIFYNEYAICMIQKIMFLKM